MAIRQSEDDSVISMFGLFSADMQQLFSAISNDIQNQPDKYRAAGQYLDSYFNEDCYWEYQSKLLGINMGVLKNPTGALKLNPNFKKAVKKEIAQLICLIKAKETPDLVSRLKDAWEDLEGLFAAGKCLPDRQAAAALIITWLLMDPDANTKGFGLTKFDQWPWLDSADLGKSRMWASQKIWSEPRHSWAPKDRELICLLIRSAWAKIQMKGENKPVDIPAENRTAPTTLTRMAELWGGDMTAKKLRGLIDSGKIRAIALNRQTYVFDTVCLPESAVKAIKK